MPTLKKLIFAPFFLFTFAILIYQLNPFLKSYDFIFSLSTDTLIQLAILTSLIVFTGFWFVLFASLAFDWKIVLPVSLVASLLPIVLISPSLGLILSVGTLSALLLIYLLVENTLKSYLNFEPNSLFGPAIKTLSSLLILVISLTYFLSISQVIQKTSFEIPDALIDTSLKLIPQPKFGKQESKPKQALPAIPPDQIELLKQNPDLLKQYGLDPSILDALDKPEKNQPQQAPQDLLTETVKQTIKDQLQTIIKPYQSVIPAVLAVLLFFILLSFISILNLLIHPLLWLIFYILEKTGFIKFTTEQRPVKKMVI